MCFLRRGYNMNKTKLLFIFVSLLFLFSFFSFVEGGIIQDSFDATKEFLGFKEPIEGESYSIEVPFIVKIFTFKAYGYRENYFVIGFVAGFLLYIVSWIVRLYWKIRIESRTSKLNPMKDIDAGRWIILV